MSFELFNKGRVSNNLAENTISLGNTSISFSMDLLKYINKPYIEIYLDRMQSRIGFKPSDDKLRGFKVKSDTKRALSLKGSRLGIQRGRYKVFYNASEGMLIAENIVFAK